MTISISIRHNILKKDADGNVYAIPEQEVAAFVQAAEALELADFMTNEWHQAYDDLNNRFGPYRKD